MASAPCPALARSPRSNRNRDRSRTHRGAWHLRGWWHRHQPDCLHAGGRMSRECATRWKSPRSRPANNSGLRQWQARRVAMVIAR